MCTCDMFPDEHPDGYVDVETGTECELVIVGETISPHMFPELYQLP